MLFNSWQFLLFLPITFFVYFIFPKKARHFFLLLASYVFYAFWNFKLIFLILFTTLIAYFGALLIKKVSKQSVKRLIMILSVVLCLSVLVFFKYFNFIASSINDIINCFKENKTDFVALNIILPVGISFYTFQTLSYVIDVYYDKIEVEENFFYFALYVSFFPQLVAGPIERPQNLLRQLKNQEGINKDNLVIGCRYILTGYVKKILIADMFGVFVNAIFNDIYNANGLLVLIGSLMFSIQILGDFAGYSDIAIGVAKLFNIDLMKNFNQPYRATSIKDFWRRWHISLSSWFKDYLYIPLGGSHCSRFRWAINILIVFTVSGLWHGASLTFILWGIVHGIYQIIGKLTLNLRDKFWSKLKVKESIVKVLRIIFTYLLVCFAWIMFRSNSLSEMAHAYKLLFTSWKMDASYFETIKNVLNISYINIIFIVLGLFIIQFVDKIAQGTITNSFVRRASYVVLSWLVIFAFIYLSSNNVDSSFIYFQF